MLAPAAAVVAEALTVQQAWAASGMECGLEAETGIAASEVAIAAIAVVPGGTTVEDVAGCRSKRPTAAAAVMPEAAAGRERLIVFAVGGS